MKAIAVLAVVLLVVGCAPVKTIEQLELEAAVSGDWSEVEKRERILARRNSQRGNDCPTGYVSFCKSFAGQEECGCITRQGMRDMFAGR